MLERHLSELKTPEPVLLSIADMPPGVDNYHIYVKLSPKFCALFTKLLNDFINQEIAQKPQKTKNDKLKEEFQESYADMMTVLIHRIKSDLSRNEIILLQFAVYRYILESTKNTLDNLIATLRGKLTESRGAKSGKALNIQDQIFWLSKHYNVTLSSENRQFFDLLGFVEKKHLQAVRRQYLESGDQIYLDILYSPLLRVANLESSNFLIEKYLLWNREQDDSLFPGLNAEVEAIFRDVLPDHGFDPLVERRQTGNQLEIYDDLGGLSACKNLLGPAPDMKNNISESFSWLDHAENFEHLFDEVKLQEIGQAVRKESGISAGWQFKKQYKHLMSILKRIKKMLEEKKLLQQLSASYYTRKKWTRHLAEYMEAVSLCRFLGGEIKFNEFQKRLHRGYQFTPAEVKDLNNTAKLVQSEINDNDDEEFVRFLSVLSQYRLHLKYFRFAHRVFNRVNILEDEDQIRLSSQAGTLYQLPMASEVTDDENRIVHHAILKADVRGSTTVTDELEKKDLNPASYFSLRFFGPINKVLGTYGANKVFIEGDAVILSFLEYEHDPQHWHSVAHACGMAKAMLSVVSANNKYSREMGLPPIELGIGVCYADYAPRYLYDGETPIMISSAIGDADRMSSCSWKLRAVIKDHPFNVVVMEIADDDQSKGEKGQQKIRYNVNGILLDNEGFEKLQQEIELHRLVGQVEGNTEVFYYGEYPDTEGKKRTLVIREGQVGLWRNDTIEKHTIDEKFYEVVTNPQITAGIQKKLQAQQKASPSQKETETATS